MENILNSVALFSESTGSENFCCWDSLADAAGSSISMLVVVSYP